MSNSNPNPTENRRKNYTFSNDKNLALLDQYRKVMGKKRERVFPAFLVFLILLIFAEFFPDYYDAFLIAIGIGLAIIIAYFSYLEGHYRASKDLIPLLDSDD